MPKGLKGIVTKRRLIHTLLTINRSISGSNGLRSTTNILALDGMVAASSIGFYSA